MVAGFVVYEILGEFKPAKQILTWVPVKLNTWLNLSGSAASLSSAFIMFVLFPALFSLAVYLLFLLMKKDSEIAVLSGLSLLLVPTMAAAHLIKAAVKMNSRIPYWSHIFSDLKGVETAEQIQNGQITLNSPITTAMNAPLTGLSILFLGAALFYSIVIVRKSKLFQPYSMNVKVLLMSAVIAYWSIFAVTIVHWRF